MRFLTGITCVAPLMLAGLLSPAIAQADTLEAIEVLGNRRMSTEALLHAFAIEVGDPYDVDLVRLRFKDLWALGVFEDITIDAEVGPAGGTVLIIRVKERPSLTSVTFEDNKVVTRTQIEDRLKERDYEFRLGGPLDMGLVFFAEQAIRDLMGESGYLDARVEAEVRRLTETTRSVFFKITAGSKTRIREIEFEGNEIFQSRKLGGALELTEARKWYWPWSKKNLYHPQKWDQDVSNIRDMYQNAGYLDIAIRPPVIEVISSSGDAKNVAAQPEDPPAAGEPEAVPEPVSLAVAPPPAPEEPPEGLSPKELEKWAKRQRTQADKARKQARKEEKKNDPQGKSWVHMFVSVEEGPQYTLGEISITGNEKYPNEILRRGIVLQEGQVLRNDVLEAGVNNITSLYENQGHIYATAVRRIHRREGETIADVEVIIEEDEPYYVSRVEFTGNSSTQDRVLRREMLAVEGELFSRSRLDVSKLKVNQLGYFNIPGEPVVEPVEGDNLVRVIYPGEEQGRNEIQVGGGYSGFEGAFFNGVYSTRNFLGRGQVLSLALQVGGASNRYQLSFQEPWFLSRPILAGFSIFRRDVNYGSTLSSESTGFGLILGRRLGRYSRLNIGYNWESVSSTTRLTNVSIDNPTISTSNENEVSSITPVYSYSSVNNPYRPSAGKSFTISMQIAGGPLGGNTAYLKPVVRFTGYKGLQGPRYLAMHAQLGIVTDWAGGSHNVAAGSQIKDVPRFQRFWLGGDTLGPRVFDIRSITPRRFVTLDEEGNVEGIFADPTGIPAADLVTSGGQPLVIELGGDRFFLLQSEFVIPLNEQAEVAFFVDVGDALLDDQSLDFSTTRVSAGVEVRFHLPIFPVPLRLIYGVPVREMNGDRTSNFTFSIGRSF